MFQRSRYTTNQISYDTASLMMTTYNDLITTSLFHCWKTYRMQLSHRQLVLHHIALALKKKDMKDEFFPETSQIGSFFHIFPYFSTLFHMFPYFSIFSLASTSNTCRTVEECRRNRRNRQVVSRRFAGVRTRSTSSVRGRSSRPAGHGWRKPYGKGQGHWNRFPAYTMKRL